jgi:hypothetical protein
VRVLSLHIDNEGVCQCVDHPDTHSLLVEEINDDFEGKMWIISAKKACFLDVFFAKLIS